MPPLGPGWWLHSANSSGNGPHTLNQKEVKQNENGRLMVQFHLLLERQFDDCHQQYNEEEKTTTEEYPPGNLFGRPGH